MPRWQHDRGRAQPAFEIRGGCASASACAAQLKRPARMCQRLSAERLIGVLGPVFIAAIYQIKQDRTGHDGDQLVAHGEPAPLRPQGICHPRGRVQPKGRPAREHQRVHLLDRFVRGQQIGFARARRAAHHVHSGGKGRIADQHADPGFYMVILRIADTQPRYIGDQIAGAGFRGAGHEGRNPWVAM